MRNNKKDFIWLLVAACLMMSALLVFYLPSPGPNHIIIGIIIVAALVALVGLYIVTFVRLPKFRARETHGLHTLVTATLTEKGEQRIKRGGKWLYVRIGVALILFAITILVFDSHQYWLIGICLACALLSTMTINKFSDSKEQHPGQEHQDRDM